MSYFGLRGFDNLYNRWETSEIGSEKRTKSNNLIANANAL